MSFHKLPPLGGLEAFVAVAQRQSLKAAAPELNISVSALSRRIQTLESHLGLALFERGAREFRLTPDGAALLESVCAAFDMLGASISRLRPGQRRFTLRVGVPAGLASFWLAPRLAAFKAAQPLVEVATDTGALSVGRLGSGLHALILVAEDDALPSGERYQVRRLAPVRVRAVCSPAYLAAAGGALSARDLARHVVLFPREHPEWLAHWLRTAGGAPPPQRIDAFDYAPVLLEAAASGLGMGLASELLAEAYIASGRLVDPFGLRVETRSSYCFVTRTAEAGAPALQHFEAWMAAELGRELDLAAA